MAATVLNDFSTTLAAPLAIDGTTVTVTTGAPAAAVGQELRVRVGRELLRVTVDTATSWTVLERAAEDAARFPAAAHDAGTRVLAPLTAAGLVEQIVENSPPFDEAAFLAAAHTWTARQEISASAAGGALLTLTAASTAANQEILSLGIDGVGEVISLSTYGDINASGGVTAYSLFVGAGGATFTSGVTFPSPGAVVGPLPVRQSGGVAGTDDLLLSHDGTRGVLRSLSGGVAVRNAADTADVLTVSDAGAVQVTDGAGNVLLTFTRDGDRPVIQFADTATDFGLSIRNSGGTEVMRFQDNLSTVFDTIALNSGLNVRDFGLVRGTSQRFELGISGDLFHLDGRNHTTNQLISYARSSSTDSRELWAAFSDWADNTDATRAGRLALGAYSVSTLQTGFSVEANSSGVRPKVHGPLAYAQVPAAPATATDTAHVYTKDVAGVAELFVQDEAGNETQISPHAIDGPASIYDADDPLPHVVKEMNHFLGGVRYVNVSRTAYLLEELLKAIAQGRTLNQIATFLNNKGPGFIDLYRVESFAQHNARTGSNLVKKSWSAEQDRLQAEYDRGRGQELAAYAAWEDRKAIRAAWEAMWAALTEEERAAWRADPANVEPPPAGDPPTVRDAADIRKPVPAWLAARGAS